MSASEWTWVENRAVNDIPGRIPTAVLPAWQARGWTECAEPTDDVEVDAPAATPEVEPEPTATPSTSGRKKENDRG